MFQIELLSGGVFWVYAVYPQNSAFLIWKDDHWVWMVADKCKPYVQPWAGTTVDNFQSIDAVPVVRCKDCKYGDYDSKSNGAMICLRTNDGFWRKETDFCSYGEYQTNTGGSNNVAD